MCPVYTYVPLFGRDANNAHSAVSFCFRSSNMKSMIMVSGLFSARAASVPFILAGNLPEKLRLLLKHWIILIPRECTVHPPSVILLCSIPICLFFVHRLSHVYKGSEENGSRLQCQFLYNFSHFVIRIQWVLENSSDQGSWIINQRTSLLCSRISDLIWVAFAE